MADPSKVPPAFRPLPTVVMSEVVAQKSFTFDQDRGGGWTINGATWDPDVDHTQTQFLSPNNKVKRNTAELWTLQGRSRNWEHPIHIHFEEGLVTSVNGQTQTPTTRQDIYR